ncbi:MAG TPA: hypothetical protein VKE88_00520, partial [Candidatus Nanoarchaeia archaeon]|nr:hypothetical protein [Candidatus Nanoarchaeia archaeon]
DLLKLLRSEKVDIFLPQGEYKGIPLHIGFWHHDKDDESHSGLDNIVGVNGHFLNRFKQGTDAPTSLISLRGEPYALQPHETAVAGGRIWKMPAFYKKNGNAYMGVQTNQLLLHPHVIAERGHEFDRELREFEDNLRATLREVYGKKIDRTKVSLFNALPKKIQEKLPTSLKSRLETFF